MKLELADFPPELLDALAAELAKRNPLQRTKPYTLDEAAEVLGVHRDTVSKGIDAGMIQRVPGVSRKLVPAREVERMLQGEAV
jgi:excisionase family DNA binding protein